MKSAKEVQSAVRKKELLDLLFFTAPPKYPDDGVARFESKWFKEQKKRIMESDEPSIPHQPPRDSSADTYFPQPAQIPSKENVLPALPVFNYDTMKGTIVTL